MIVDIVDGVCWVGVLLSDRLLSTGRGGGGESHEELGDGGRFGR